MKPSTSQRNNADPNCIYSLSDTTVTLLTYAAFALVSFLFMYAFSLWISPLYKNWYGCDASFFTLAGREILAGRVPYRDFYDLKGPYFFFIQALGQLIGRGHTGIFILEVLSLFASLILLYRIGTMFISRRKSLGVIVFFLLAYISMLWGGNCLEEFCLPLNLLAVFLNLRLFTSDCVVQSREESSERTQDENDIDIRRLFMTAMITGICFTVMAFSKITAGAPLTGLVIGVFILLIVRRMPAKLGYYILYFILGALLAFLPLLIYFGYHNSILRMLYCTFIFGFNRSRDLSHALSMELEIRLADVIFSLVFILLHMIPGRDKSISKELCILTLPMSAITYLVLHLGDSYIYYFITGMPCMLLSLILFLKLYDPLILFKDLKQSLCWLLIFVFVYHYTGESINTIKTFIHRSDDEFQANYYRDSKNMGLLIPESDRNSVFSFDIDMQWYEINNILPCNEYIINLQYFIALEPSIEPELIDFMENTPPKWMICSNTLQDYLPQMNEIVTRKYDCIYSTDVGLVYLLKD